MRSKVGLKAGLASLIVAAPLVLWVTAAEAFTVLTSDASIVSPTTVGQVAPATFTYTNQSSGVEATGPVIIDTITLFPSCAATAPAPTCPTPDPGVFQVNGPFVGTGNPGASAGARCPTSYTASTDPATGAVTFTPVGGPPVLEVGGECRIAFTTTTLRTPSVDVRLQDPFVQTAAITSVLGRSTVTLAPGGGFGFAFLTVLPGPATIVTTASPPRTDPGEGISDVALVTGIPGSPTPTGTVSFQLYGPTSPGFPTCTPAELFDPNAAAGFPAPPPVRLTPTGPTTASAGSGTFGVLPRRPTTPGNYVFVATYSGDANYAPVTSPCNDPAERVVVEPLPTIAIVKTATPPSMPEPGGGFTFDVVVTNTSPEPLTITSLIDNVYGNLNLPNPDPRVSNNTCAGRVGTILTPDPDGPGPQTGGTLVCSFVGTFNGLVTGPVLPSQVDIVTVVGADNDIPPNTATASDDARVELTPAPPTIVVDKVANPLSLPEPGGAFTFNVAVRNTTTRAVTITTLTDTVNGVTVNLNLPNPDPRITSNGCAGSVGIILAPDPDGPAGPLLGGVHICSFVGTFFSNVAGSQQPDVVRAVAVDVLGAPAEDSDDAVVTVTDVLPTIEVVKTANPLSLPEPGGGFTFSVVVTNTSIEPVTVTSLTDNVYGNLNLANPDPRVTNNTCAGRVGTILGPDPDGPGPQPGGSFTCSFVGTFFSNVAGSQQPDTVTAIAVDNENNPATDTDDAIVTVTDVLPTILVDKSATPATRLEPGGLFTFDVVVTNTSTEPVTITSLTDNVYGNLNLANPDPRVTNNTCAGAVGRLLAADPDGPGPLLGGQFICAFTVNFTGVAGAQQPDTVTAVAVDNENNPATDTDDAIISITNVVPTIVVEKTVTPGSLPEPGGNFAFRVVVTNTSIIPLTITSLTDTVYGNLNLANPGPRVTNNTCAGAVGQPLAANGGTYTCTFNGSFTGVAGNNERDVVTAVAVDAGGESVSDDDDATVTLTDVPPTIIVDKTVTPDSQPEPTGTFRFSVVVTNTSFERVRITTLTDDVYGDLNSATNPLLSNNTCVGAVGRFLAPDPDGAGPLLGGTFSCAFDASYTANAGDEQIDVVTATVVDDQNTPATDSDDAVVTLTDVPPTVQVVKSATPETRPAPGGAFTFNVVVTNTSNEDVTITSLTDDVYGNIATQGTCTSAIGTVLAPDETYSCSFTGTFQGASGSQRDVVTVNVIDDDDTTATDTDDATVTITPAVVVGQNINHVPTTPNNPSSTTTTTTTSTLPKTGAGVADMVLLALGLLALGGLFLLSGSMWSQVMPVASVAGAAGAIPDDGRRRRSRRRKTG